MNKANGNGSNISASPPGPSSPINPNSPTSWKRSLRNTSNRRSADLTQRTRSKRIIVTNLSEVSPSHLLSSETSGLMDSADKKEERMEMRIGISKDSTSTATLVHRFSFPLQYTAADAMNEIRDKLQTAPVTPEEDFTQTFALFIPVDIYSSYPNGHWIKPQESLLSFYQKVCFCFPSSCTYSGAKTGNYLAQIEE